MNLTNEIMNYFNKIDIKTEIENLDNEIVIKFKNIESAIIASEIFTNAPNKDNKIIFEFIN